MAVGDVVKAVAPGAAVAGAAGYVAGKAMDLGAPIVGQALANQEAGRQTRKTRGGQQLSNEEVKQLQAELKDIRAELRNLDPVRDKAKIAYLEKREKELVQQLGGTRGHSEAMAGKQGGTAKGGGGLMASDTQMDSSYGGGGGSSGGGSAFTPNSGR